MTNVTIRKNQNDKIIGFDLCGHAGYSNFGDDIVCASISTATQMTVNGINELCREAFFIYHEDEVQGRQIGMIKSRMYDDAVAQALLKSMELALLDIQSQYPLNIKVTIIQQEEDNE